MSLDPRNLCFGKLTFEELFKLQIETENGEQRYI